MALTSQNSASLKCQGEIFLFGSEAGSNFQAHLGTLKHLLILLSGGHLGAGLLPLWTSFYCSLWYVSSSLEKMSPTLLFPLCFLPYMPSACLRPSSLLTTTHHAFWFQKLPQVPVPASNHLVIALWPQTCHWLSYHFLLSPGKRTAFHAWPPNSTTKATSEISLLFHVQSQAFHWGWERSRKGEETLVRQMMWKSENKVNKTQEKSSWSSAIAHTLQAEVLASSGPHWYPIQPQTNKTTTKTPPTLALFINPLVPHSFPLEFSIKEGQICSKDDFQEVDQLARISQDFSKIPRELGWPMFFSISLAC